MTDSPLLVPAPRRLDLLGGLVAIGAQELAWIERAKLGAESGVEPCSGAYVLELGARVGRPVRVECNDEAGFSNAISTLAQLRHQYGERLPRARVRDWPEFATRGFLLDVSRGRVPDAEERRALVRRLAGLKLNRLELYTEHTFAYEGHEAVWRGSGALTSAEIRALDVECAAHGIELVANQNCFGHFEHWLKHPEYAGLAETHEAFVFEDIELQGPFSLCPTDPCSLELVRDLLGQLLPNFSSGRVNLNCDETQDVGQGRSASAVAERGAFSVYSDFVGQVAAIARSHGKRPEIWADIVLKAPERLHELPDDLVYIAWGYEPDHPFEAQAAQLSRLGREFLLCCGTGAWRSWIGRTRERRGNLENVIAAGLAHRPQGLLIAEWGDMGHTQVEPIGRLGVAEFAARAWNPGAAVSAAAISLQAFGDRSLQMADWLAELGDADLGLRERSGIPDEAGEPTRLHNANAIFEALHPSGFPNRIEDGNRLWAEFAARIESLAGSRPRVDPVLDGLLLHALGQARMARRHPSGA